MYSRLLLLALLSPLSIFGQDVRNDFIPMNSQRSAISSEHVYTKTRSVYASSLIHQALIYNNSAGTGGPKSPPQTTDNQGHVYSAPGVLFAGSCGDSYPPSWCSGSDIGAWINAAVNELPTGYGGYKTGTILLPSSNGGAWTTNVAIGPGTNLIGQGKFASVFRCTVRNGDCLTIDESASSGKFAHSVESTSKIEGFRIDGNGAIGQSIIHFKDAQGIYVSDIVADGASESGGSCFWFEDVKYWTERNTFVDDSTGYGCHIGWRFTADADNPNQPHPSFGYNRFLDIKGQTNGAQALFSFEGNSYLYNSTFRVTFNKGGIGSTIISMSGNADYYLNETYIFGEENGSGGHFLDLTSPGNIFTYVGQINESVSSNLITPGAIFARYGDDAGYSPAASTIFRYGIQTVNPVPLAAGSDLDSVSHCGNYWGKDLRHGPTPLAGGSPSYLKIENFCSDTSNNYILQRVNSYYSPALVYERNKDDGGWTAWRQVAYSYPGVTGALPAATIAAGKCITLTAVVANAELGMVVTATPNSYTPLSAGLDWSGSYVSAPGKISVPICNLSSSPITPSSTLTFNVRAVQ